MPKKQVDRRPDENPAKQNPARPEVSKPDALRRMGEEPDVRKGFGKPEGVPIDKQMPKPGGRRDAQDIFDGDRSDRESGRPIQLDDDESEPAIGAGRSHEGSQEGERTPR
jgi:hypothetical protein